jgi:hypothetical protein
VDDARLMKTIPTVFAFLLAAASQLKADTFPPTLAGGYQALLYYDAEATGKPAGLVKLTVATTGTFSGSLITTEYKTYPLTGKLTYTTLSDTAEVTGGLSIKRVGVGVLPLALTLSIANATQTLSVTLSGDTGVYSSPGVPVNSVSTTGFRNLTLPVKTTADFAGKYTLGMPLALAAVTGTPDGSGYASVTIGTTGLMTLTGKAGDGTAIVASLIPGPNRNYLLFLNPNLRAASYIAGKLNLTARPDAGFHIAPATTGSDLQWAKVGKITDISYRTGIPNVGLLVSMEPWKTVPTLPAGQTLGSFLGMGEDKVFDLALAGDFNAANYGSRIPTKLGLTKLNKLRVAGGIIGSPDPITASVEWAKYVTLAVAPTTGLITGTIKISDSVPVLNKPNLTVLRTLAFAGVLMQPPAGNTAPFAHGLFSVPPLNPKTESTTTSSFAFNGPIVFDPAIVKAAGTAGTYTSVIDRRDNGGAFPYPSSTPANGATVTFVISPDLATLTFNGRKYTLQLDTRPVGLQYRSQIGIFDQAVVVLNLDYLYGNTGRIQSGIANYVQGNPFRQGDIELPRLGTVITKR